LSNRAQSWYFFKVILSESGKSVSKVTRIKASSELIAFKRLLSRFDGGVVLRSIRIVDTVLCKDTYRKVPHYSRSVVSPVSSDYVRVEVDGYVEFRHVVSGDVICSDAYANLED